MKIWVDGEWRLEYDEDWYSDKKEWNWYPGYYKEVDDRSYAWCSTLERPVPVSWLGRQCSCASASAPLSPEQREEDRRILAKRMKALDKEEARTDAVSKAIDEAVKELYQCCRQIGAPYPFDLL